MGIIGVFLDRFEITIKYCGFYDHLMHERMHSPKLHTQREKKSMTINHRESETEKTRQNL